MKMTYYCTTYSSPLGPVTWRQTGEALVGCGCRDRNPFLTPPHTELEQRDGLPVFQEGKGLAEACFAGKGRMRLSWPWRLPAVPFARRCGGCSGKFLWCNATTYGEIARKMAALTGKPGMAAQAVGGAGHNPISLIIPCHRVIGAGGQPHGLCRGPGSEGLASAA